MFHRNSLPKEVVNSEQLDELNDSKTNSGKKNLLRALINHYVLKVHITGSRMSEELLVFFFSFTGHSGFFS